MQRSWQDAQCPVSLGHLVPTILLLVAFEFWTVSSTQNASFQNRDSDWPVQDMCFYLWTVIGQS